MAKQLNTTSIDRMNTGEMTMPLLKIGKTYINTDHVLKWNVNSTNSGGSISAIDKDGENIEVFHAEKTAPEVMMALVRWLDANATDIMATPQPAPVETPRKFNVGDKVHFWDDADDTGTVLSIEKSAISGQHFYLTTLNPDMPYYDDDLEPAD